MQSTEKSYGKALPDQVERIAASFDTHLELISDVRELYKDRAALERDYAAKLQLLVKKTAEKKNKIEASLVVGEDPTKIWDVNTLKQNSLNAAYTEIMDSMVGTAQDHVKFADALMSQVVDVLKAVEKKSEETKKKEMQFFQKLLTDRDRVYTERTKNKQKYDEECTEIEAYRQKQGRAPDDKHADRVAKQAEQQRNDMLNSKNAYLISIAVANDTKTLFYDATLPELEDQFQILQKRLVERFTKVLQHTQALQLGHLDTLKTRLDRVEATLARVNVDKDQNLFIEHNIRPFTAPNHWVFEPCATHYDTNEMSIEPAPKIFLQNKLSRCRSKLAELEPLINTKRRELDQLSSHLSSYTPDHTLGNVDETSDNLLETSHQLAFYLSAEKILNAEAEIIMAAIGDDEGAQQPHSFKSSSFSIPTQCGYCKASIWGLSKQGKTCKLCGISVHSKCELKVPADCRKANSTAPRSSTLSRQTTSMSRTSTRTVSSGSAPAAASFVAPDEPDEESYPTARVLFDFTATSGFELDISEGATVGVVEPDDGSGWAKVADGRGRNGLVPASYLDIGSPVATSTLQPPVTQQGSGQYVRAIYSYEAQGDDELDLKEGEAVELTSGLTGGQSYGNGWWEGLDSMGRKGIFPSNYVEIA